MSFLDDMIWQLTQQNVGVLNKNLFVSSAAVIPSGNGPFLTITETGGRAPSRIQNQNSAYMRYPTAQIVVRGTQVAALTMMAAAYLALDGIYNMVLNGVFYYSL